MRPRRHARTGLVAALVVAVLPVLWLAVPVGAHAATDQGSTVVLTVTSMAPVALAAGGDLVVSGIATNEGTVALADPSLQLRLSTTAVGGRDELAQLASSTDRPPGDPIDGALFRPDSPLMPGVPVPFTLTARSADIQLSEPGVYPLSVEVIADDPSTGDRTRFGATRTFLPYAMAAVKPTRVAMMWPVLGTPSRDADGLPIKGVLDTQLVNRLGAVVQAGSGSHVTWLVDGDLLESASQLATGAPTTAGVNPAKAPPDATAAQWLAGLAAATTGGQVEALAYADPDLVATNRGGLAADLVESAQLGPQVAQQVLGPSVPVGSGLAWPADGTLDDGTLSTLTRAGDNRILLADTFAAVTHPGSYTPSALGPIAGTQETAVVGDTVLSSLLAAPPASQGGPVMARQRMMAELAMVGLELPSVSRSVVVVAPRHWGPDVAYVQSLLTALRSASWVRLATLGDLQPDAADGPERKKPTYPAALRGHEVAARQLATVREGHASLDALNQVLTEPGPVTGTYLQGLLRGESAAWRTARDAGQAYATSIAATIATTKNQVRLVPPGAVTLAARSGRIPVTVTNNLDQPVTVRVGVDVVPAVRLTVDAPGVVTVPAHASSTLDVAAEATANGSVQLSLRLLSPDGTPYGPPSTLIVQITGLGAVAQLLVVLAVLLLAGALLVRVAKAVRAGRRRPGSPASVRERVR